VLRPADLSLIALPSTILVCASSASLTTPVSAANAEFQALAEDMGEKEA